jgi:hypothetical protein
MREILKIEEGVYRYDDFQFGNRGTRIHYKSVRGERLYLFFPEADTLKAMALLMKHFEQLDRRNAGRRERK